MLNHLIKLANHLDSMGLSIEVASLDGVILKLAQENDSSEDVQEPLIDEATSDGVLDGGELVDIGTDMLFNEWRGVISEIVRAKQSGGWGSMDLHTREVELRMKLVSSGIPQQEIDEERAEIDPDWYEYKRDSSDETGDDGLGDERAGYIERMMDDVNLGEKLMDMIDSNNEAGAASMLRDVGNEQLDYLVETFVEGFMQINIPEDEALIKTLKRLVESELNSRS